MSTPDKKTLLETRIKAARATCRIIASVPDKFSARLKVASAGDARDKGIDRVMDRYQKQLDVRLQKEAAARDLILKA